MFFTSDWSLASSVNNTKGDFHYKVDNILVKKKNKQTKPKQTNKTCDRGCFSQMGDVLSTSLIVSKMQKLGKGSILQVHNGVHLIMEVAHPLQ